MRERREFTRHEIGGHLEITSVIGGEVPPSSKGRVINCSRGGALFRLPAPSRGFFRKRAAAALSERDSITCVLRLPPAYASIEMFGEIVRVTPDPAEPGQFDVGLRFFHDVSRRTVMNPKLDVLGQLLEPEKLKAEVEALHEQRQEDIARRAGRREEVEELSCSEAARMVSQTSQRLKAQAKFYEDSDPDAEALSCSEAARMVSQASQRLKRQRDPQETQRLKKVRDPQETQRLTKVASRRLKRQRDPQETQRLKKVRDPQETQRLKKQASERQPVARRKASQRLDTSTLRRLDESRLLESAVRTPTLGDWAQARLHAVKEPRLLDFGGQLGVRGRAVLINGTAVIALPEAFAVRAEPGTLTVHLTPRGPAALYVSEAEPAKVTVEGVQNRGTGPVQFDYLVIADRGASLRA